MAVAENGVSVCEGDVYIVRAGQHKGKRARIVQEGSSTVLARIEGVGPATLREESLGERVVSGEETRRALEEQKRARVEREVAEENAAIQARRAARGEAELFVEWLKLRGYALVKTDDNWMNVPRLLSDTDRLLGAFHHERGRGER